MAPAADVAWLGKSRRIDRAHPLRDLLEDARQPCQEFVAAGSRLLLGFESGHLFGRKALAPQVGHQTIRAPRNVPQMETNRTGAAGLRPNLRRGESVSVFR